VLAKRNGELEIEPIQRGITYPTAPARQVICRWAQTRPAAAISAAEGPMSGKGGLTPNESERE
jgi:hypothetical protein